jgi:hypothetical protein
MEGEELRNRNTVLEGNRLSYEEGWNLPGACVPSSRTRGGGSGRPNLKKRLFNEIISSESDSEWEMEEVESSEDGEEQVDTEDFFTDEDLEEEDDEDDDEEDGKPPPTRLLLEYESLKKCMEKNCRCPKCNGPVNMDVKTICIASNVMVSCVDKDCGYVDVSDLPATAHVGPTKATKKTDRERSTDFAINVLWVLGFMTSGDGSTEAARLLGVLGLPNDTTMQSRSFGLIEDRISPIIQSVTNEILLENLTEEVRMTFAAVPDKDESDVLNWRNSLRKDVATVFNKAKYPAISVSYDMGWQQRSSGKKYNSPSGHAFFVGGLLRKPIALQVKSRICNYCANWRKKHPPTVELPEGPPVPIHSCTLNHSGSASAMEPKAALDMIVDLYDNKHVSIDRICIDDDASTPALLKWSNADYCKNNNTDKPPQVQRKLMNRKDKTIKFVDEDRPDSGRLPGHVTEPKWVADPNHRKKLFTKDLRAFKADTSKDRFGMSDMDVTRLGKNYGYMI